MNHKKRSTDRVIKQGSQQHGSSKQPAGVGDSDLPAGQELTTLLLSQLRPHPQQAAFNPPCSAYEDAELAAAIKPGHQDPIHVMPPHNKAGLPAYTILDGHRRCAALLSNGKKTAKAIIRHDLRDADATTVELVFLKFNHTRRHYDVLAFGCNLVRQRKICEGRNHGRIGGVEFYNVSKILAAMHQLSLRNAQRYVHVACTPIEIQNAHRQGHLSLSLAARVDGLSAEVQATIAQRIAKTTNTTKIASIVKKYLSPRFSHRPASNTRIAFRMLKKMKQVLSDHQADYANVHGPTIKPFQPFLTELKVVVDKLLIAAEQPGGSIEELFKNLVPSEEPLQRAG